MRAQIFDLPEELDKGNTRANRDRVALWVGNDARRFARLMDLYLHGERRKAQLAAGAVFICVQHHPVLADPWLPAMIRRMKEPGVHDAVRRCAMWTFQVIAIPRRHAGRIAGICFESLSDISQPIAVRVYAMTVLTKLCQEQPELTRELHAVIAAVLPYGTAAFRARARRELRRLGLPDISSGTPSSPLSPRPSTTRIHPRRDR